MGEIYTNNKMEPIYPIKKKNHFRILKSPLKVSLEMIPSNFRIKNIMFAYF